MPLPALALALGKKLLAKKVVEKAGSALQRKAKPTKKKTKKKKTTKKKITNTGQAPQPAQGGQRGQAPQGANSTFNSSDPSFRPSIVKNKPLKRAGVGSKSTKQKVKEYGKKQKQKKSEEIQLNAQSSNPGSSFSNVRSAPGREAPKKKTAMKPSPGKTPTAASKKSGLSTLKSPTKRFCGGKSKPFKRMKRY